MSNIIQGAVDSGLYRNLFVEYGISQAEVDAKIADTWTKLFDLNSIAAPPGTDQTDPANTRIYYEINIPQIGEGAFILDSGNTTFIPTGDVRSEGMAFGMMIAVQLDKKDVFDKLWRWAKTYMYNLMYTQDSKNSRGYFSWAVDPVTCEKLDTGITPGSEFYFATALLFASARWGDGADILEYGKYARQLLYDMVRRSWGNDPWDNSALFRREGDHWSQPLAIGYHMPVFCPYRGSSNHTAPSYHLPAFYEIWAEELERDISDGSWRGRNIWKNESDIIADAEFYRTAAKTSRAFFRTTVNQQDNTWLGPDYANFDGSPTGGQHVNFRYNAWRIAMNIGMDYAWWAKDPWQNQFADGLQAFFVRQGVETYGNLWKLDGSPIQEGVGHHSPGLVSCNMVISLAATHPNAWLFVQDFWHTIMTTGKNRYYDGCLYMIGLLHASGNFKAYLK